MSESVNAPDLNAVIGNLLANPAALSGMMNLIGGLRTPPPSDRTESEKKDILFTEKAEQPSEASIPASQDTLGANLAALAPLLSGAGALAPVKEEKHDGKFDGPYDPMKRRRCLLEAIRPYLSPTRCENLNLLLRILDILSLLSPKK